MASIRKDLPAGEALRRHMRKVLKSLADDLSAAQTGAGVHPARKRLKLGRSLLRMMEPALGPDTFSREDACLKEAAHALAGLRQREAMVEAVHKLGAPLNEEDDRRAIGQLTEAISGLHGQANHAESIAGGAEAVLEHINAIRGRIADWALPKRDIRLFVKGMRESYKRARKKLHEGLSDANLTLLHEARKSVIHHYHQLDLLKPVWPQLWGVWLAELQDLRETLGDLNDLDEMDQLLKSGELPLGSKETEKRISELIDARRNTLVERIRKNASHLFAEQPSSFAARMAALWENWAQ